MVGGAGMRPTAPRWVTSVVPRLRRRLRRTLVRGWELVLLLYDTIVLSTVRRSASPRSGPEVVGVLNLHGHGDVLLSMHCLREIRRLFAAPRYHLVCLCSPRTVALVRQIVPADEIRAIDPARLRRSLGYRGAVIGEVARAGFGTVLQPTYNRFLVVEDALVRATRAPVCIGQEGDPRFTNRVARRIADRWYTRLVPAPPAPFHDLELYQTFLRHLGTESPLRRPTLPAPRPATLAALAGSRYVLCALDTTSPLKTWPASSFRRVLQELADRFALRAVLCGTETRTAAEFRTGETDWIDLIGRTSLADFLALLAGATLVLTNDSAALHFATALNVPTVAVAGGGLPFRYHPYPPGCDPPVRDVEIVERRMPCFGCGWRCRYIARSDAAAPCLTAVSVADVLQAAVGALARALVDSAPADGATPLVAQSQRTSLR